ncbi:TRAM domain-containing protein [Natrialbaceae archaeon A-arb3/5]
MLLGVASLFLGALVIVLFASWVIRRFRGGNRPAAQQQSWESHTDAQQREPPVELGERYEAAVHEFTEHHTGEQQALCKIEGFVVFVEDVPNGLEAGDVIEFTILSFNRGHTSATATYERRT